MNIYGITEEKLIDHAKNRLGIDLNWPTSHSLILLAQEPIRFVSPFYIANVCQKGL